MNTSTDRSEGVSSPPVAVATHRCRLSMRHGRYIVVCDVCDIVGHPDGQDYEADAQAIADRHEQVGGFEQVSS